MKLIRVTDHPAVLHALQNGTGIAPPRLASADVPDATESQQRPSTPIPAVSSPRQLPWTGWHWRGESWVRVNSGESWKATYARLREITQADQRVLCVLVTGTDPGNTALPIKSGLVCHRNYTRKEPYFPKVGTFVREVYDVILEHGRQTTKEVASKVGKDDDKTRRAIDVLTHQGLVRDSGERRTGSGNNRMMVVWEAV